MAIVVTLRLGKIRLPTCYYYYRLLHLAESAKLVRMGWMFLSKASQFLIASRLSKLLVASNSRWRDNGPTHSQ